MQPLRFTAVIEIRGINPYVLVSATRIAKLKYGWKKPMPVLVQINDKPEAPWKINMMPSGNGDFYLYLHEYVRKESKTKVGDKVRVTVSFDESYKNGPMHPMPDSFRIALAQNKKAKDSWQTLSPSQKKELLRYFSQLKTEEAKSRNVKKAIEVLSGTPGRFMARDWNKKK